MADPAIFKLLDIMSTLRAEGGCPWDREQTLESLKNNLVEETYEVVDAIDSQDRTNLQEELGDLLLQVVFQSQICTEEGSFTFDDVARGICEKLIRRHPHIFGSLTADTPEEVLRNWEAIKKQEKGDARRSVLSGVPRSMPALDKAWQVQKKVARVGFDWDNLDDVVAKVTEELREIEEAIAENDQDAIQEELGDLLFATVNLCRHVKGHPEDLLKAAVQKFTTRFQQVETLAESQHKALADCSLAEMDALWDQVKASE